MSLFNKKNKDASVDPKKQDTAIEQEHQAEDHQRATKNSEQLSDQGPFDNIFEFGDPHEASGEERSDVSVRSEQASPDGSDSQAEQTPVSSQDQLIENPRNILDQVFPDDHGDPKSDQGSAQQPYVEKISAELKKDNDYQPQPSPEALPHEDPVSSSPASARPADADQQLTVEAFVADWFTNDIPAADLNERILSAIHMIASPKIKNQDQNKYNFVARQLLDYFADHSHELINAINNYHEDADGNPNWTVVHQQEYDNNLLLALINPKNYQSVSKIPAVCRLVERIQQGKLVLKPFVPAANDSPTK